MSVDRKQMNRGIGIVLATMLLAACAGGPGVTGQGPGPATGAGESQAPVILVASAAPVGSKAPVQDTPSDELFDPFAKGGEETVEEYDPWEPFNVKMFEFNRQVDRWVLKPVAKGYNFVVPNAVQIGFSNLFYNVRFPQRFFNNIFQGKFHGAGVEMGRFLLNTTFGFGGLYDVAKDMDIRTPEEDTGQTLGFYGVPPGPYLVLPLLPPFNLRDFTGFLGDIALNPMNWLVAPIIEVEGIPSVIAHSDRMTSTVIQLGARAFEMVNDRSLNLEKFQGVEEATLDLYTAVRNGYLQKRVRAIQE
ncbi:MAG TPA: VacJ family lipoprotein [Nitrospira sp.]|nr:VacJ family lipoprotein [Nitrospira sp.]